jgi:hypothetical protein
MKISLFYIKAFVLMLIFFALVCGILGDIKAQTYNLSVGTNVSTYQFTNSDGVAIDFLKRGSGSHFKIGAEFRMLDTTSNYSSSSKKAIYFTQHTGLAKLLSLIHADVHVESNQFNAVGDNQNIAFSYQTNYVGLSGGLGISTPSVKNWTFSLQGRVAGHKLIQGNQALGTRYVDLSKDSQFADLQLFMGLSGQLQKRLNDRLITFLDYQQMQTLRNVEVGKPTLNFLTGTISFGIKILK